MKLTTILLTLLFTLPGFGAEPVRKSFGPQDVALHLRKPSWAVSMTVRVNGRKTRMTDLDRTWKPGDRVEVDYGMAHRVRYAVYWRR